MVAFSLLMEFAGMTPVGIIAVLIHVADWRAGLRWYERAFPNAIHLRPVPENYGSLKMGSVLIEIVDADDKVTAGPSGSIVCWRVDDFDAALAHFISVGARLYRGPLCIEENKRMCQVQDPWGNCIGLRGP